jgi:hypothetical protein
MIGTPEPLLKSWIGHSSGNDITSRYDKSTDDREWRRTWADKCGIGFELPKLSKPGDPRPLTRLSPKPAITAPAKSPEPTTLVDPASSLYVAQTEDLDPFFYQQEV